MKKKAMIKVSKFLHLKIVLAICLLFSPAIMRGQRITLSYEKVSLDTAIKSIIEQTDYKFVYSQSVIDVNKVVSVKVSSRNISTVLDELFRNTNIAYKIVDKQIALSPQKGNPVAKQKLGSGNNRTITGLVRDQNGQPLVGASVSISGQPAGTFTDINGHYSIDVNNDPNLKLAFKYLGMDEKKIAIGTKTIINTILENNIISLQQVIVTGYQTISRERAVGSFDIATAKDIENKMQTNIMDRLEGMVSGLNNYGTTDNKGNTQITIRGVSSLYANTKPLYVVDGMPYEGDIQLINPNDVINISILKDATANSIYGAQAANGVIVITTRSGQAGKTSVRYSGSVKFTPKPDLDYLKLINSSELIDLQIEGFNLKTQTRDARITYNPVIDLLFQHKDGLFSDTELQNRLAPYRKLDNRKQIEDEFARTAVMHQHNLSVSGGNEKNTYLLSLNYQGDSPNQKESNNWRVGVNIRDNMKFTNWLRGDVSFHANFSRNSEFIGAGIYESGAYGSGSYEWLVTGHPSYYMLRDNQGNVLNIPSGKSKTKQEELLALGLLDESYSPITNHKTEKRTQESDYYRIQAGLNATIISGLTADLKFQLEKGYNERRDLYSENSKRVRSMINDAATYNKDTKILTLNVPRGGQLATDISTHYSYTLRGQLNYITEFDKHAISALLGAERRLVVDKRNKNYYMGYDNGSLEVGFFNPLILRELRGTQALSGLFRWNQNDYVGFKHVQNRYVSFYFNASYTYNRKYALTGSARIDQSNLFGTDPKYQYRPLWSLGAGWYMKEEKFMQDIKWINLLNPRITYGVTGNVAKETGPYLQFENKGVQWLTKESALFPKNPKNAQLRWEKTATTNVGFDASMLNSRIRFSFDFYNKSTKDLLGYVPTDPITGWSRVLINYGDMYNRGYEISLHTTHIKNKTFTWDMGVNFSFNKNKLTNVTAGTTYVSSLVSGGTYIKGYPMNSLFSYRYAGISDTGMPLIYTKDGDKPKNTTNVDDIDFSGTRDPKYTASLLNKFSIKDFDISFLLVYYGGHKLRTIAAPILTNYPSANVHRSILNRWQKPGDELREGVTPGLQNKTLGNMDLLPWTSSDRHLKKADYIKLRDVTISYRLPKSAIQNVKLEGVTFTLQINNLWWKAKNGDIDPEFYALNGMKMGDYTPTLRLRTPATYTLGTVINF